jgi:hypothetical protein
MDASNLPSGFFAGFTPDPSKERAFGRHPGGWEIRELRGSFDE